jgi:hypothetical protein
MSGRKQAKKAGARKEKSTDRRHRDFEQPIARSVTRERGEATSNFTDGEIAGADHKHDIRGHLKYHSPISEPRRRTTKNPE